MIVNGIDIIGYEWVKFVKSDNVHHEIKNRDIILYGNNSKDFSYLFDIVSSVDINDSEYIDVSPGVISRIGSISVQSNSVEPILLNIILTDTEQTEVLLSNLSVTLIVNTNDKRSLNLGLISEKIKIISLAKDYSAEIGNIRNVRIFKDKKLNEPYYNSLTYSLNNVFYTNVTFTRALNRLNYEIAKLLPGFDFIIGKRDRTNETPNSIYCSYSEMEIEHRHFFRELRRNMMHKLLVNYEFRVTDDIKFTKLQYEMSNYDFITNICELVINDDNDEIPWSFAIHWTIEPYQVDLFDPKTNNDTVSRSVKCTAELHLFTSIDNYVKDIRKKRDDIINNIKVKYEPCHEIAIITTEDIIMD